MRPIINPLWNDLDAAGVTARLAELDLDIALNDGISQYELDQEIAAAFRQWRCFGRHLPQ